MIINNVWSLHYENFIIQIEGTEEEQENLKKTLEETFTEKTFLIIRNERRV